MDIVVYLVSAVIFMTDKYHLHLGDISDHLMLLTTTRNLSFLLSLQNCFVSCELEHRENLLTSLYVQKQMFVTTYHQDIGDQFYSLSLRISLLWECRERNSYCPVVNGWSVMYVKVNSSFTEVDSEHACHFANNRLIIWFEEWRICMLHLYQ